MDRLEQGRGGAACAKAAQFMLEGLDRALHAPFDFRQIELSAHETHLSSPARERLLFL